MNRRDLILADTSVWIRYLRDTHSFEARRLHELLEADRVVLCGPVLAEIISGSRNRAAHNMIKDLLTAIPCLEPSFGIWERMGEARFALARKGVQQSLIDLWIAEVAREYEVCVWTLDKDFERITPVIAFKLYKA